MNNLTLVALLLGACGSDDDLDGPLDSSHAFDSAQVSDSAPAIDVGPPDSSPADAALSGTLTITATGITGAIGKIALIGVLGMGGFDAVICEGVTSDPGVLDNGAYTVTGGIYMGGNHGDHARVRHVSLSLRRRPPRRRPSGYTGEPRARQQWTGSNPHFASEPCTRLCVPPRGWHQRIEDILAAVRRIQEHVSGSDLDSFARSHTGTSA